MENERNTDKQAGYIIKLGRFDIIMALCWLFKNVLICIIANYVDSMIGRPLLQLMRKIIILVIIMAAQLIDNFIYQQIFDSVES